MSLQSESKEVVLELMNNGNLQIVHGERGRVPRTDGAEGDFDLRQLPTGHERERAHQPAAKARGEPPGGHVPQHERDVRCYEISGGQGTSPQGLLRLQGHAEEAVVQFILPRAGEDR